MYPVFFSDIINFIGLAPGQKRLSLGEVQFCHFGALLSNKFFFGNFFFILNLFDLPSVGNDIELGIGGN